MYLVEFVNSTFETKRATGNLEFVDLTLEKKYHPPEPADLSHSHLQNRSMIPSGSNGNGTYASTKIANGNSNGATLKTLPVAKPRRTSREDLPGVGSQGLRRQELDREWSFCINKQNKQTTRSTTTWKMTTSRLTSTFESTFADGGISIKVHHHDLLETTEEDRDSHSNAAGEDSRTRDNTIAGSFDRELNCENDRMPPSTTTEGNGAMNASQQRLAHQDHAQLDTEPPGLLAGLRDLGVLTVPIATPPRRSRLSGGNVEPHVDLAKLSSLLSSPVMETMDAAAELPSSWFDKKLPNLPKPAVSSVGRERARDERESSLRYPTPKLMTKAEFQAELSFRLWEREPTPKRRSISVSRDFQELDLENSHDSGFLAKSNDLKSGADDDSTKRSSPNVDALLNPGRAFNDHPHSRRGATPEVDDRLHCELHESEQDYSSPSSFTCGHSPTSLFSDDQELSVSSSDNNNTSPTFQRFRSCVVGSTFRKSPRSVLSQEPDEVSHFTSDSSETGKQQRRKQTSTFVYSYNYESSELESPMRGHHDTVGTTTGFKHHPFQAFTYSVGKDMAVTSSDEERDPDRDPDEARDEDPDETNVAKLAGSLQELGFALNHREPWLVNDAGVLDDDHEDLEFLVRSPVSKRDDTTSHAEVSVSGIQSTARREEETPETADQKPADGSSRKPKRGTKWLPYVTGNNVHGENAPPVRTSNPVVGRGSRPSVADASRGDEKTPHVRVPKRSVNFAPDLVKEIPYSPPRLDRKNLKPPPVPRKNPNAKLHDEEPAAQIREVVVEEGPSIMTSRRRWRRNNRDDDDDDDVKAAGGSTRSSWSFSETRSRGRVRVAEAVPCAGRLFSWPQRFAFKLRRRSRSSRRRLHRDVDDDEDNGDDGFCFVGDQSFGMSARRDAELVRRILKGSQKKYSNSTVDDILKENFG